MNESDVESEFEIMYEIFCIIRKKLMAIGDRPIGVSITYRTDSTYVDLTSPHSSGKTRAIRAKLEDGSISIEFIYSLAGIPSDNVTPALIALTDENYAEVAVDVMFLKL